jgi:hypothetical protein
VVRVPTELLLIRAQRTETPADDLINGRRNCPRCVWIPRTVRGLLTLQRDAHRCMVRGPRCLVEANDVIHVLPTALGDSDQTENLLTTPTNNPQTSPRDVPARGDLRGESADEADR